MYLKNFINDNLNKSDYIRKTSIYNSELQINKQTQVGIMHCEED